MSNRVTQVAASDLSRACEQYARQIHELHGAALPSTLEELVTVYEALGRAVSTAEACLVCALDAADPSTGLDEAEVKPYTEVIRTAFQLLREAGATFARLDAPFAGLVHPGGGWHNRPVPTGDRTLYENTFKTNETLTQAQRQGEYQARVDKFVSNGGDFDDIILLNSDSLRDLNAWSHYDYVMLPNHETRAYPTAEEDRGGKPKAGHSLLIGTEHDFEDRHVISAGEFWLLKDYTGELEAIIIANNSGHFKPSFVDLPNTVAGLAALDLREDQIVLFGGPNNIPTIFREIGKLHGVQGLDARLPPDPGDLIDAWGGA